MYEAWFCNSLLTQLFREIEKQTIPKSNIKILEWGKIDIPNIRYFMATSFSGGGSQSTWRESPTMSKQLVSFITCGCESSAPFFVIYKDGWEPTPYWQGDLIQVWLCWKYYIWSAFKFKNNFHTSIYQISNINFYSE
jgi:hypothetical protein